MVRDTGIEPVTSSVSGKRSPAELIARVLRPDESGRRGGDGNRTRVDGFAGRCLTTRPLHRKGIEPGEDVLAPRSLRADDGIRTRDPHLGKVMRYQLRHIRIASRLAVAHRVARMNISRRVRRNTNPGPEMGDELGRCPKSAIRSRSREPRTRPDRQTGRATISAIAAPVPFPQRTRLHVRRAVTPLRGYRDRGSEFASPVTARRSTAPSATETARRRRSAEAARRGGARRPRSEAEADATRERRGSETLDPGRARAGRLRGCGPRIGRRAGACYSVPVPSERARRHAVL